MTELLHQLPDVVVLFIGVFAAIGIIREFARFVSWIWEMVRWWRG